MEYRIGVDLGGTHIAAGLIDENYQIIKHIAVPTSLPCAKEEVEEKIASCCYKVCEMANISITDVCSVGIGTPGSVNKVDGVVGFNANFAYENWELAKALYARLGKPVYIENDANAAALGEMLCGSAKGYQSVLFVTIGTGIGGGLVINGGIYSGHNNAALEIGHMVIQKDGRDCMCGRKGCFEKYASASALVKGMQTALQTEKTNVLWHEIDNDLKKLNGKLIFNAVRNGNALAKKVMDEYISYLACGFTNIINIFQPEVICVGGGISNEMNTWLPQMQSIIDREEFTRANKSRTQIKKALLGNDAGIIGAAFLNIENK